MNQISLIKHSVERSQKNSLPNSKMLSLTYRNGEEVTFIYNSHKTFFFYIQWLFDVWVYPVLPRIVTLWCNRWDSKCHLIYISISSHVEEGPHLWLIDTSSNMTFLLLFLQHIDHRQEKLCNFLHSSLLTQSVNKTFLGNYTERHWISYIIYVISQECYTIPWE